MNTYDPDRPCPKCGSEARSVFQGNSWYIAEDEGTRRADGSRKKPGTMHRECKRCHYSWGELPLDAKEASK